MQLELIIGLGAFAFVSSITPGPNNLMLMSSGANFGFKRSLPHMLGVELGFVLMVFLVGLGLSQVFNAYPLSYDLLKVFSISYLLYLAYKIATSSNPQFSDASSKPMTFIEAAAFQWVNPKGWTMALSAVSVYSPSYSMESIALVALAFGLVGVPSVSVWTALGQQLQRWLTSHRRLQVFNYTMAALLVGSIIPVLL